MKKKKQVGEHFKQWSATFSETLEDGNNEAGLQGFLTDQQVVTKKMSSKVHLMDSHLYFSIKLCGAAYIKL